VKAFPNRIHLWCKGRVLFAGPRDCHVVPKRVRVDIDASRARICPSQVNLEILSVVQLHFQAVLGRKILKKTLVGAAYLHGKKINAGKLRMSGNKITRGRCEELTVRGQKKRFFSSATPLKALPS
jgi:hypothetical protein